MDLTSLAPGLDSVEGVLWYEPGSESCKPGGLILYGPVNQYANIDVCHVGIDRLTELHPLLPVLLPRYINQMGFRFNMLNQCWQANLLLWTGAMLYRGADVFSGDNYIMAIHEINYDKINDDEVGVTLDAATVFTDEAGIRYIADVETGTLDFLELSLLEKYYPGARNKIALAKTLSIGDEAAAAWVCDRSTVAPGSDDLTMPGLDVTNISS